MTYLISTKNFDSELYSKVQKCEKMISSGVINQSLKNHSLLGRVLLSYILFKMGMDKKLTFTYGENEKPYLKNRTAFFNISHSGDYVICSVSESEVGCDVQKITEYKEKIAKRFFTVEEKAFLDKSDTPDEHFTKLWTMKESVLKKTGEGITGGLSSVCFASCLQKNSFIEFGYHFKVWKLTDAYICVCSDSGNETLTEVNKEEIEKFMDSVLKGEL